MSLASLVISNYSNSNIIYQYGNSTIKKDISSDAKMIASKAKVLRLKIGVREKLACDYGLWFVIRGDEDLFFAACVSDEYPERVAYGLIDKIQTSLKQKMKNTEAEKAIGKLKKQFNDLCQKYKDSRVDKVKQAQYVVGELKSQLQKGVSKMFENQDNLNSLNQKTVLMKNYAKSFEKGAEEVQKTMFWHKWKIYIIMGIIIGSVLAIAGIVLYLRLH